jgi:hypothetical protein
VGEWLLKLQKTIANAKATTEADPYGMTNQKNNGKGKKELSEVVGGFGG